MCEAVFDQGGDVEYLSVESVAMLVSECCRCGSESEVRMTMLAVLVKAAYVKFT